MNGTVRRPSAHPGYLGCNSGFNTIAHVVWIPLSAGKIHVSTCRGPPFLSSVETMRNGRTGGSVMVDVAKKKNVRGAEGVLVTKKLMA
jgi:hypothetical protein